MATPSNPAISAVPVSSVARVRLWDDYGPVGEGASLAHYIRGENGNEYIVKGPSLNPSLPYVAANELIAARLAATVALPVLDFRLVERGSDLYFGSTWLEKDVQFYPAITDDLFQHSPNRTRCYDIVAFDYWLYNTDRHQHNLLVRRDKSSGSTAQLIVLNDHSHALIQAGTSPKDLASYVDAVPPVRLDFLRSAITSRADLASAVSLIEGIADGTISTVVNETPDLFLAPSAKPLVDAFLRRRRDSLRVLLNRDRSIFPALKSRGL